MLKPLFDNVLIEPLEKEEVTSSGLYIPDTAKEKPSPAWPERAFLCVAGAPNRPGAGSSCG